MLGLGVTLAIVVAAWAVRWLADPLLPPGFPYVTFFPAVIVTSFLFGVRLGSLAALLGGLLAWYYFILPRFSFALDFASAFALGFYVFVVATDLALVHWMQRANRSLARERETNRHLADTRELLFRELQHRVSNNLQVAAALLAMQKKGLADPAARAALDDTAGRLTLIGQISRQLYDPSGSAERLLPFLEQLGRSVLEASGRPDLALLVEGDGALRLEPDAAISTALVVAEAVSNAVEHGFAGGRAGTITLQAMREGERGFTVAVRDDGRGLPDGFVANGTSLGLRIATTLARGRGGAFRLSGGADTCATLSLPAGAAF